MDREEFLDQVILQLEAVCHKHPESYKLLRVFTGGHNGSQSRQFCVDIPRLCTERGIKLECLCVDQVNCLHLSEKSFVDWFLQADGVR